MPSLVLDIVRTGLLSGLLSGAAACAFSQVENRRAAVAINAVSHIASGSTPPAASGAAGRNFLTGASLHLGASLIWATAFEGLFGRSARRRRSAALLGAAASATAAYLTDYRIVPPRLRPGMERYLSRPAVIGAYVALAAGFVLAAHPPRRAQRAQAGIGFGSRVEAVQGLDAPGSKILPGTRGRRAA